MKAMMAILSLTLLLVGCGTSAAEDIAAADTKLYSVMFYADWCPSCKKLEPALTEAREMGKLDEQAVLFIRFDLTDSETKAQSAMLAKALGLDALYAANDGKTGYALLLDAATLEPRAQLTKTMTPEAIAMTIKAGLAF